MTKILRTDSGNTDFISLVKHLDADLAIRDGEDHAFYAQYNKIIQIKHAIVAYENELAVACGAMRELFPGSVEIKRMYTLPAYREKGIASIILGELEKWAMELNYEKCLLETGKRQPEAIELYKKHGYKQVPNYGQYQTIENSVCFEKYLTPQPPLL